jgi:hypothetical protein
MTLFAHNQILPLSLVIGLSVIAMIWVTNASLNRQPNIVSKVVSMIPHQPAAKVEKTNCYRYLRTARSAGSSYWWQKYKSCIAAI